VIRIVSIIPDAGLNRELATACSQLPDVQVSRALTEVPALEDLLRTVRVRKPDCLFICAENLPRMEALLSAADDVAPGLQIIAVGRQSNIALMEKLMHLGVREYLTQPITPARLAEVLDGVRRRQVKHPMSIPRSADLYTFLPAKPGVGTSDRKSVV